MTEINERFLIYQRGPGDDIPIRVRGDRAIAMVEGASPAAGVWYCYDVCWDNLEYAGSSPYESAVRWLFGELSPLFTNWPISLPDDISLSSLYDTIHDGVEAITDFSVRLADDEADDLEIAYPGMRRYRARGRYRGRTVLLWVYLSEDLMTNSAVEAYTHIKSNMVDWCVDNYFSLLDASTGFSMRDVGAEGEGENVYI